MKKPKHTPRPKEYISKTEIILIIIELLLLIPIILLLIMMYS